MQYKNNLRSVTQGTLFEGNSIIVSDLYLYLDPLPFGNVILSFWVSSIISDI